MLPLPDIYLSFPPITWTGVCLGVVVTMVVLLGLVLYWSRGKSKKSKKSEDIPLEVIADLGKNSADSPTMKPN
jgi:hypothetical protein